MRDNFTNPATFYLAYKIKIGATSNFGEKLWTCLLNHISLLHSIWLSCLQSPVSVILGSPDTWPPYSLFHCELFFPSQHLTLFLYPKGHSHPRTWFPLLIVSPEGWGSSPYPGVRQVLGTTTFIQLLKWKPIARVRLCEWSCWYKIVSSIVASVLTSASQKAQGVRLKKERDGLPKMM